MQLNILDEKNLINISTIQLVSYYLTRIPLILFLN